MPKFTLWDNVTGEECNIEAKDARMALLKHIQDTPLNLTNNS